MKLIYSHFFQLCRTLALFHWFQWDQFQSWEFFWYLCSDFLHSSIHRSEYFWQSSLQNASCLGFWRPLAKMSTIVYMIGCFKQNCFVVPLSSQHSLCFGIWSFFFIILNSWSCKLTSDFQNFFKKNLRNTLSHTDFLMCFLVL